MTRKMTNLVRKICIYDKMVRVPIHYYKKIKKTHWFHGCFTLQFIRINSKNLKLIRSKPKLSSSPILKKQISSPKYLGYFIKLHIDNLIIIFLETFNSTLSPSQIVMAFDVAKKSLPKIMSA